jgi:transcriptional regulator with XRE-family HTH domain
VRLSNNLGHKQTETTLTNNEFVLRRNLKILLEDRKVKANELARATGIARQVISDWMSGTSPRNLTHLKRVADYFDVTIDALCFGEIEGTSVKN